MKYDLTFSLHFSIFLFPVVFRALELQTFYIQTMLPIILSLRRCLCVFFVVVVLCFCLGDTMTILKIYSWVFTQKLLVEVLGDHMSCMRLKLVGT